MRWSGNNRAEWHDYRDKCIYHITLKKNPDVADFGRICGDCDIAPGSPGSPYLAASALGRVVKESLKRLGEIHPALRLYQYALMPDHLHMLLSVESGLDEILGRKLAAFKVLVNKTAGEERVFMKGFNDQIIGPNRSLDSVFRYLRENPYRLAVRRRNPDFFRRVNSLSVGALDCDAYGNLQLLENPFKDQVVIHRADNAQQREWSRRRWLHNAANGGVLVSPFISPAEKSIRGEVESLGGKIILITHEAFPERFKPAKHDFSFCSEGRLLIISLGKAAPAPLTRADCLAMNELATKICSAK